MTKSVFSLGGGDIGDELRKEIQALRHRVEQLEVELEGKNDEIKNVMSSHKISEATIVSNFSLFKTFFLFLLINNYIPI